MPDPIDPEQARLAIAAVEAVIAEEDCLSNGDEMTAWVPGLDLANKREDAIYDYRQYMAKRPAR